MYDVEQPEEPLGDKSLWDVQQQGSLSGENQSIPLHCVK